VIRPTLAIVGASAILLAAAGCARGPSPAQQLERWSRLELEVDGGSLIGGRVELRLREEADRRILETHVSATVLGATVVESTTESEVDAATGRTLVHRSYSPRRARRYTFHETDYRVERLRRADPSSDRWKADTSTEFPYPIVDGRPAAVVDYYGMLLRLRELGLDGPGDEAAIHVATSRGVRAFRVHVAEARERRRSYTDLASGEPRSATLAELRLRLTPDDPGDGEGFLQMEGETEVWVEAVSKAPLEISGKVPNVPGRVRLVLRGVG
jgi:hypothetical protein